MGWLKNFVKWSRKRFIIKWIIVGVFGIIGIAGVILPILQGLPMLAVASLIAFPNKNLSKKVFKHEKFITYMLVIGLSLVIIIPATLYGYGVWNTEYGRTMLAIMQIGQEPIRAGVNAILS